MDSRQVYADRVHHYSAPIEVMFSALVDPRQIASWLRLRAGEVAPTVLEATSPTRVVWSSLWPASPTDTIEFDLSDADPSRDFTTLDGSVHSASSVRFRWFSEQPPDERGIALTRQRLNEKFGADIRGVVSEFDARSRPSER